MGISTGPFSLTLAATDIVVPPRWAGTQQPSPRPTKAKTAWGSLVATQQRQGWVALQTSGRNINEILHSREITYPSPSPRAQHRTLHSTQLSEHSTKRTE